MITKIWQLIKTRRRPTRRTLTLNEALDLSLRRGYYAVDWAGWEEVD